MNNEKKVFFLDAYALIYRAYYAFINRPMFNSSGLNTSAIYGFTVTLDEVIRNQKPTHIAVVFDPPSPTFRHKIYPEYKANREETPEDIKKSLPYIKKIIEGFNIPIIELNGYEADDVIGTLAKQAENKGYSVFMMTPDKDYAQLVSDKIFIYKPRKSGEEAEILGAKEINEIFQVNDPEQVIDIFALWGDSSDNIPGAPGIGEKTAKKLISEFQNLDNIFLNIEKLKGRQKEIIKNYWEQIKLSQKLVTIDQNVPVILDEEELFIKEIEKDKLRKVFEELEFRNIANRILSFTGDQTVPESSRQGLLFEEKENRGIAGAIHGFDTIKTKNHTYYLIDDQKSIDELIYKLAGQNAFCFDTETTSINTLDAELIGVAFSFMQGEAYYLPMPGKKDMIPDRLKDFKVLFEDQNIIKLGQNIKYDIQVLENYGIKLHGKIFDTMIAHYLIQPELRHNLDYLAESYLNYKPVSIEELIGKKGADQGNMKDVPLHIIKEYSCEDADLTWQLYLLLGEKLKESDLVNLAENVEFPLIRVLSDMERSGVRIDTGALKQFGDDLNADISILEKEIYDLAGETFNISSPKQLGEIIFDKLKISKNAKRTKTKIYSTSEDVLVKLSGQHPIINKVLDYRTLRKLLSTYVEALPKMINEKTGNIHTSFNQSITSTGRLSSNNPNLQNIPFREERGREIRKAFIPTDKDHVLLSADYSQIELRLMAHMSKDGNMLNAFKNNEDIHQSTAAKIFNISADQVTRDMRRKAKTANFGIIYGISAFGLSQRLNIQRSEAKELIDGYFRSYPGVKKYMEYIVKMAREYGYVETLMGRRRYLKDINSRNAVVRGFAERNAINAPLQGSAADIIKIAMIDIHEELIKKHLKSKMILQVHDELVFDVFKPELDEIKNTVIHKMEHAYPLDVPLVVDCGVGNNWLEAHI
jgi:DNA polymerase-1